MSLSEEFTEQMALNTSQKSLKTACTVNSVNFRKMQE
jgi:hypothetical protein